MADLIGRAKGLPGKSEKTRRSRIDMRQNLFRIPDNISVSLGLRWDFIGAEPVDLDASCVAFNENGDCLEAVFFNHLVSEDGYMVHSGDNQTGEDNGEDDETIVFHMDQIPPEVHFLMVCVTSYTGADFTLVDKATCRLVNNATREMVGEFQLGIVGHHTATLLCAFSRVAGADALPGGNDEVSSWWDLREINIPCSGYTFCDVLPKMLDMLAIPEDQRAIRLETMPDYTLIKVMDKNVTLSQLYVGLGWDGDNDLDVSAIFLDANGAYVDHVHAKFGKLKSRDGCAGHSGDKLNGYDVEGDDEFVTVDLFKMNKNVVSVFFVVNLFDGFAKTLGEVPKCYLRIANKPSPMDKSHDELSRVNLSSPDATAAVCAVVRRKGELHFEYQMLKEYCTGKDWIDVLPFVRHLGRFAARMDEWPAWKALATRPFAVELTVMAARGLHPQEPHQFSCHCYAWVADRKGKGRIMTKSVENREHVEWNESFTFVVSLMDNIRVVLYEHAMVGHVDIDLSNSGDLLRNGGEVDDWIPLVGHNIRGDVRLRLKQVPMDRLPAAGSATRGGSWCVVS